MSPRHLAVTRTSCSGEMGGESERKLPHNLHGIPTESSRPRHHPNELSEGISACGTPINREKHARCAEVLHYLRLLAMA